MSSKAVRLRLLQDTNARLVTMIGEMNTKQTDLERRVEYWRKAYDKTNQEFLALKHDSKCSSCISTLSELEDGKTFVPCEECIDKSTTRLDLQRRVEALSRQVDYWQECYETLLQEFYKNDRGDNGYPNKGL